jgi:hypothetical protein
MEMLKIHIADAYGQQHGGGDGAVHDGGDKVQLAEMPGTTVTRMLMRSEISF